MTEAVEERMEQQVTVEEAGPARKKITIVLPETRIKDKIAESFSSLRSEAALPGFRQGRVPLKLLQRRFGEDVKKEVSSQLFSESYQQAMEEESLKVIGEPDFGEQTPETFLIPEAGDWTISFEVEIVPDFELPDLSTYKIQKPVWEVTDEEVQTELERYADTYGTYEPVEEPAKEEDYIIADVKVTGEDGTNIDTMTETTIYVPGEKREYKGAIGSYIVEDLGKHLEGKKAGDAFNIDTTGSDTHKDENVAGKKLSIDLNVTRVDRSAPLPTEDLIEKLGFESEEELLEQLKEHLEGRNKQREQTATHKQLSEQLVENLEFELPEDLSNRQVDMIVQRRGMELLYQGKTQEEVDAQQDELKEESKERAQTELKQFFILAKAAEELEIDVTDQEINHQIMMIAIQQQARPEQVRQQLEQTGRLQELALQIREGKTLDSLLEKCDIEEVDGDTYLKENEETEEE